MEIQWYGQSLFQITTTKSNKERVRIIIDPYNGDYGLKVPKLKGDILLITHQHKDHNNVKAVSGNPFLIEGPGEYEVRGIMIEGIHSFHDKSQGKERGENTIYTIETEGIKLSHMGDFGEEELNNEQLEEMGDIDILMIPVGGIYTISAKEARRIVSQIEPKIVIPMHYAIPGLKLKLDSLKKFLDAFGLKKIEPQKKLSIKKKDLSFEETKVIVLEPL